MTRCLVARTARLRLVSLDFDNVDAFSVDRGCGCRTGLSHLVVPGKEAMAFSRVTRSGQSGWFMPGAESGSLSVSSVALSRVIFGGRKDTISSCSRTAFSIGALSDASWNGVEDASETPDMSRA